MRRFLLGLFAALTLSTGVHLQAQDFARVYFLTPAPGNASAVGSALANHTAWLSEQGDSWRWTVYQVVAGHNVGDWILRSGSHSLADFDERDEGFGVTAVERFQGTVAPLLSSIRMEIEQSDEVLTRVPDGPGQNPNLLFHITDFFLETDGIAAFNQSVGRMLSSYEEAGEEYSAQYFNIMVGPEMPKRRRVRSYENWADFANAPNLVATMTEAYGEGAMDDAMATYGSGVKYTQDFVIRYFPEMTAEGGM